MFSAHLEEYAQKKYDNRKEYFAPIWEELEEKLAACTKKEAILIRFLYGTMPVRDAGEYDFEVFAAYVRHAIMLREHVKWCQELPEDIFVHHVLYYRINSEDISDCRKFFYEQLKERIAGLELEEAVLEINYWCAEHAVYESTDSRTASPMTMYRCKKGRCGEESTFAVTAYRSMGIPARQVYTPRWAHCDDNHAWVEVYIHGKWYFLGACEPESVLNKGWFTGPASRGILIHSRTFSDFVSNMDEECIGREDLLVYYNNTSNYAKTKELSVTVKDRWNHAVKGASVAIEILNMAEYFPGATLITDQKGEVKITIGIGDIRIRAWKDGLFAEQIISPKQSLKAELVLLRSEAVTDWITDTWEQIELSAPEEYQMHPGTETKEQKEQNEIRLAKANELRESYIQDSWNEELAAHFPKEHQMLKIAGDNFMQLYHFLTKDKNPYRKQLLHSLTAKDYKDLKADILEDHLACEKGGWDEELYVNYLLCPRVYLEELTKYRSFICGYFTENQKNRFRNNPEEIWCYIKQEIAYTPEVDYQTICATPVGCLKLKQGNPLAQKILFVAICRSLGIPARLDRVELWPEYYWKGSFIIPKACKEMGGEASKEGVQKEKASLRLLAEDGSKWNYYQNYTLGKLEGVRFVTLDHEGIKFKGNELMFSLESGVYRLITTMRMPNGGQHAAERIFCLKAGEQKDIQVMLGETKVEEMLISCTLEDRCIEDEAGNTLRLSEAAAKKPVMLAFLGVGQEPTEHVLNELMDGAVNWNQSEAEILMVLKSRENLKNATLLKTLKEVNGIRLFFDNSGYSESIAAATHVDPEKLPVLAAVDEDFKGMYASSGYNVGSVDLMLKILKRKL